MCEVHCAARQPTPARRQDPRATPCAPRYPGSSSSAAAATTTTTGMEAATRAAATRVRWQGWRAAGRGGGLGGGGEGEGGKGGGSEGGGGGDGGGEGGAVMTNITTASRSPRERRCDRRPRHEESNPEPCRRTRRQSGHPGQRVEVRPSAANCSRPSPAQAACPRSAGRRAGTGTSVLLAASSPPHSPTPSAPSVVEATTGESPLPVGQTPQSPRRPDRAAPRCCSLQLPSLPAEQDLPISSHPQARSCSDLRISTRVEH